VPLSGKIRELRGISPRFVGFKLPLKSSCGSSFASKSLRNSIYDYEWRIARYRRIISGLRNSDVALRLLDHLASLGLSAAALSNNVAHLVAVLRLIDFDVAEATRGDVERVVAKINQNPNWREKTKKHKTALRRLIQYAKYGSCEKGAPVPPEVGWMRLSRKTDKDSCITRRASRKGHSETFYF